MGLRAALSFSEDVHFLRIVLEPAVTHLSWFLFANNFLFWVQSGQNTVSHRGLPLVVLIESQNKATEQEEGKMIQSKTPAPTF